MSIATKTGDEGTTGLMYNRRVSKADPRVEAYGSVDELNAALGLVKATSTNPLTIQRITQIQRDLVILMGELATLPTDLERYLKAGFSVVSPSLAAKLDEWVIEVEARNPCFKGWATPGATLHAASLDLSRTACRRAERRVCLISTPLEPANPEIIIYLNRLSDLLWLMAREAEGDSIPPSPGSC